mmetsp:Transcript_2302/g.2978  ORF Transcript_2302/g.2978 Transcript_2302/m.2978 type:complete len:187 (+) Transcript_2302:74-634(+)|eukprot:CAMPEP_0172495410 /NCGR_PEP_ID=MMETSP1066-20121228/69846_1 /TAXON_ID=671091 /ORGANISM="Coscinodiscus wailesii, Strain CCMP2513" /LENGTH=186 /DNA_ID=CAMNT_0013267055 /DNA_START=74 /DNA_END=634 /DNA_ORIENTATION=-
MASSRFAIALIGRHLKTKATSSGSNASLLSLSSRTTMRSLATIIPGIGKGKTSTGLVGIPVDHDAPQKIIDKNQALLDRIRSSDMPPDAGYYEMIEAMANYRIKIATQYFDDPEKIEEECRCGQVEELVMQADDEMTLLNFYLEKRIWELIEDNVPIYIDPEHPSVKATEYLRKMEGEGAAGGKTE